MFERVYRVKGERSPAAIWDILAAVRRSEETRVVTLGTPPFERDWLNRITAVRLRFEQGKDAAPGGEAER